MPLSLFICLTVLSASFFVLSRQNKKPSFNLFNATRRKAPTFIASDPGRRSNADTRPLFQSPASSVVTRHPSFVPHLPPTSPPPPSKDLDQLINHTFGQYFVVRSSNNVNVARKRYVDLLVSDHPSLQCLIGIVVVG